MLGDGSDGAIRAFESSHRTAAALSEVPIEERLRRTKDLRARFGALAPNEILRAAEKALTVSATSADGDAIEVEFEMDAKEPGKLVGIRLAIGGAGAAVPSRPMTEESRVELVEAVARAVASTYVYPDIGKTMAARIRQALASGAYAQVANEKAMAVRLTEDLRAVSHDRHLSVDFSPADPSLPGGAHSFVPAGADAARDNYAFKKVEVLAGNVGLIRLDLFLNEPEAMKTADAAMAFLEHADAIVFDLRHNGGGDPEMIRHLSSYFFSARTHLNSMVDRDGTIVDDFWTGDVPGKKFRDDLPLFVLTSARTFSGAEEFTYNLRNLKRATIVGETTGGGAHPVRAVRVDDRFIVSVPFLRALNPITKTNWEGVGVTPDVKTAADEALDKALGLARRAIGKR
ncbi:MAG TPA: S41 family peptidase [Thermoanaerobaculia bacterium]|nr:S41 family peptidase [Thermoanaerobaculia bacterium]